MRDNHRKAPAGWKGLFVGDVVLADEATFFVLVNALDFFFTYVLLSWPGSSGYEANPIANYFLSMGFRHFIAFKFTMTAIPALCCELVARQNYPLGRGALLGLTVAVGLVAAYGASLILRHLVL